MVEGRSLTIAFIHVDMRLCRIAYYQIKAFPGTKTFDSSCLYVIV